jgi:hypothetical protein
LFSLLQTDILIDMTGIQSQSTQPSPLESLAGFVNYQGSDKVSGAPKFVATGYSVNPQPPGHRSWLGIFSNDIYDRFPVYADRIYSANQYGRLAETRALTFPNGDFSDIHTSVSAASALRTNAYVLSIGQRGRTSLVIFAASEDRRTIEEIHVFAVSEFEKRLAESEDVDVYELRDLIVNFAEQRSLSCAKL